MTLFIIVGSWSAPLQTKRHIQNKSRLHDIWQISSPCDPSEISDSWEKNTIHCSFYFSRRHLSLYIFTPPPQTPAHPLSGKMEFMSPCISLRPTDGYTQRLRRTYTAGQSDCFFCATLFVLYAHVSANYRKLSFFFCEHYSSISLLALLSHGVYLFYSLNSILSVCVFLSYVCPISN